MIGTTRADRARVSARLLRAIAYGHRPLREAAAAVVRLTVAEGRAAGWDPERIRAIVAFVDEVVGTRHP